MNSRLSTVRAVARRIGFDEVVWVRFIDEDDELACEAHGVRHRRPVTIPISLASGRELQAAGCRTLLTRAVGAAS